MAKKATKTVTVEQIGSPIRRAEGTARDAGRPRPQQDARSRTLEDTPPCAA